MTNIPALSRYQFGLLTHTAKADIPVFLLAMPNLKDTPSQRFGLKARHNEIKSLMAAGLIEEASDEFREHVREHEKQTGRRFKVFGLTEIGFKLFQDTSTEHVN